MRTLRIGQVGPDVETWEHFLIGNDPFSDVIADGAFDIRTRQATVKFQTQVGFTGSDADGVVGPRTMGKAMELGFDPLSDDDSEESGPNWPLPPQEGPLSLADRGRVFGTFRYRANPTPGNAEGIVITDGWASKNIVQVSVPQLTKLTGSANVSFHSLAAKQFQQLFADWEAAGLMHLILTWGGSWAPRFIRGSRTTLSNHAWATAFDINVQWNMLGARPALKGEKGSVRELVEIANRNGFYWGGHFKGRLDGMHFEIARII